MKQVLLLSAFSLVCCVTSVQSAEPIVVESAILKIIETIQVPTESAGVLEEVLVKEGTLVKRGDLLARIRDTQLKLQRERSLTELQIADATAKNDVDIRYARKSLAVVTTELQRALDANLEFPGAVPAIEVERLRLVVERKKLEIEQAEHAAEIARLESKLRQNKVEVDDDLLNRLSIRAPMDGMIIAVDHRTGEWVQPGADVVRLVRTDRLRVEGLLHANKAPGIIGKKILITVKLPNSTQKQREGVVTFVHPESNPINSNVRVWAEVDNSDNALLPGLRVDAVIIPE